MDIQKILDIKNSIKINNFPTLNYFKGELKEFQKIGVLWMFVVQKGLLADACGAGKTVQLLGLLALLKEKGLLNKTLLLAPAASIGQWVSELSKFTPSIKVVSPSGLSKGDRFSVYNRNFEVLLSNYEIFLRDYDIYANLGFKLLVADEGSVFRNHSTQTAMSVKSIASACERVVVLSATPVQNNLMDLHSIYGAIDSCLLGGYSWFKQRYCCVEKISGKCKKRSYTKEVIVGYKNLLELKQRIWPYYLRRTIGDIEEELPDLVVVNKWLELSIEQRKAYEKLKTDLLKLGDIAKIRKNLHTLQMCLDGLRSLNKEFNDVSVKLDTLLSLLKGDLAEEKVVVFSRYKSTIAVLCDRLKKENIGFSLITGNENASEKELNKRGFWSNANCRVLIGTSALEMSLNLQCSKYIVAIDLLFNPARVEQLVGRVRRIGSKHSSVVLINLLVKDSFEERILRLLRTKQAVIDTLFDEQSEIFGKLSDSELMELIK